jgi:hypothetical protein
MIADLYLSGVPRRVGGDDKKEVRKAGAIRRARFSARVWLDKRGTNLLASSAIDVSIAFPQVP